MKKSSFLKKAFNYSIFFFASACLATVALVGNTNKVNVAKADTITDLTGYTWVGNVSLDLSSFQDKTYGLSFSCNSVHYTSLKFNWGTGAKTMYYGETAVYGWFEYQQKWANENYRTIEIEGGEYATDSSFISWLQNYGTLTAPAGPVSVTGVELNYSEYSLSLSGSVQLTATVSPDNATNKDVTWSTSNSSVANVSSEGLVSAVAEGNATITVTTDDGSFTDTCSITVTNSGGDEPVDVNDGLYTIIEVSDSINWNFKSLWLDNFSYADDYNSTLRNNFFDESGLYGDIINEWTNAYKNGQIGHHYYGDGVNLSRGTNKTNTFYIPAWITDFTIEVQDDNSNNNTYLGYLSNLYSYNVVFSHTVGPQIGSGLGKTIQIDMNSTKHGSTLSGDVTLVDTQTYSDVVTVNRYYLSANSTIKAMDSRTNHLYYLPSLGSIPSADNYVTDNVWYEGSTYAGATSAFNTNSILLSSSVNVVAKYELYTTDGALEIRFSRPSDWGNNTVCIYTWNDAGEEGAAWPGYQMTYLKDNEYGQSVWTWSPSASQPLYSHIKFNNNNNGMQSDDLSSPSVNTQYWYDNGWQHSEIQVTTMDIYLYDYDNAFEGEVYVHAYRDETSLSNGDFPGVAAEQLDDIATNGLIYKITLNDRFNRVVFSKNGESQTEPLTPSANYCYVLANDIAGKNTWWNNINYVFAHNFSQHTMLMDGTVPTDDHSSTQYCSSRYTEAKTHFEAIMNSGYGQYVLTELNNNFSAAMVRFASWARANGESINTSTGAISSLKWVNITTLSNNSGMIVIVVLSIFTIGIASAYLVYRKKN